MGFAQEVRDFTAGYTAITDAGNKKRQTDIDEKRVDWGIEYDQARLDIMQDENRRAQEKHERALSQASAAAARASESAIREAHASGTALPAGAYQPQRYRFDLGGNESGDSGSGDTSYLTGTSLDMGVPVDGYQKGGTVEFPSHWSPAARQRYMQRLEQEERAANRERVANSASPEQPAAPSAGRRGSVPDSRTNSDVGGMPIRAATRPGRMADPATADAGPSREAIPQARTASPHPPQYSSPTPSPHSETVPKTRAQRQWDKTKGQWADAASSVKKYFTGDDLVEGAERAAGAVERNVGQPIRSALAGAHAAPEPSTPPRPGDLRRPKTQEDAPETRQALSFGGEGVTQPGKTDSAAMADRGSEPLSFGLTDKQKKASAVISQVGAGIIKEVLNGQNAAARAGSQAVGPEAAPVPANLITGENALTPEELQEIYRTVDPNGQIPVHMETITALTESYNYFAKRGEFDKAYNVATKILAGEKLLSQTLGTLAIEAAKAGNTEEALRLFGDAVDRFPSGHQIEFAQGTDGVLTYSLINNGEVVEQGQLSGADFMTMAGEVANGRLFMKGVMQFVDTVGGGGGGRPQQAIETYADNLAARAEAKAMREYALNYIDDPEESASAVAAWDAELDRLNSEVKKSRFAAIDAGVSRVDLDQHVKGLVDPDQYNADSITQNSFYLPNVGPDGGDGGSGGGADIPRLGPNDQDKYEALPRGARYIDPDGVERVKP